MIHNIVVADGKAYKAVKPIDDALCDGCSFTKTVHCQSAKCTFDHRKDKSNVIYKPHYRIGVKL